MTKLAAMMSWYDPSDDD